MTSQHCLSSFLETNKPHNLIRLRRPIESITEALWGITLIKRLTGIPLPSLYVVGFLPSFCLCHIYWFNFPLGCSQRHSLIKQTYQYSISCLLTYEWLVAVAVHLLQCGAAGCCECGAGSIHSDVSDVGSMVILCVSFHSTMGQHHHPWSSC